MDNAPMIALGIKKYHNALWIKNSNNVWVQIAKLDNGGRITYIFINNQQIINMITPCCPMNPDMIIVPVIQCNMIDGNAVLMDNTIMDNNGNITNNSDAGHMDSIVNGTVIEDNNTTTADTPVEINDTNDTADINMTDMSNDTVTEDINNLNDTNDTVLEDIDDNLESDDLSSYDDSDYYY